MAARRVALTGVFLVPLAFCFALSARHITAPRRPDPQEHLKPRPRWTPPPVSTRWNGPVDARGVATPSPRPAPPLSGGGTADPSPPPSPAPAGSAPRSIPGLDAAGLLDALRRSGLECSPVSFDGGGVTWTCSVDGPRASYLVVVHGDDTRSITWLRATVSLAESDFLAVGFLASVAGLDYSGAQPARASDWVSRSFSTEGTVTIGPVRFALSGAPGSRTLDMAAEGLAR